MGIWQWVKEVTVSIFWPWFKEVAWPFIRQHLKDLIIFAFDLFKDQFKKWTSEWTKKRTESANQKAEEYEQKAKSAESSEDIDKYKAVAQVWREVAEQFLRENEELKNKFDEIFEETQKKAFKHADDLDIDFDFSDENPKLMIGDNSYDLPALPSNDSNKINR